jgi:hypothetical protein
MVPQPRPTSPLAVVALLVEIRAVVEVRVDF